MSTASTRTAAAQTEADRDCCVNVGVALVIVLSFSSEFRIAFSKLVSRAAVVFIQVANKK